MSGLGRVYGCDWKVNMYFKKNHEFSFTSLMYRILTEYIQEVDRLIHFVKFRKTLLIALTIEEI